MKLLLVNKIKIITIDNKIVQKKAQYNCFGEKIKVFERSLLARLR